jgi:hypothetical protein
MYKYRKILDPILISILPHFITLYYTLDNLYYSSIIILSSCSSIIWHYEFENNYNYYLIDYFFALLLTSCEIFYTNQVITVLKCNILMLFINKFTDILSYYKILNYTSGHTFFHISNSLKTIFIASKFKN